MILLNDLKNIIEQNVKKYPRLQPQDAVKLVYQHVFGSGQNITDAAKGLEFLKKEYETVKFAHKGEDISEISLTEDIGNWYTRVNLLAIKDEDQLLSVNSAYMATKSLGGGNLEYFISRLYFLSELAGEGMFEFSREDMDEYLEWYERNGYPAVNHSGIYKEFYDPAYRIIDVRYVRLLPLITEIRNLMKKKDKVIIALDGRSLSGKTTAAELLSLIFDASVIHMSDFALPVEKRTRERYAEPGGNVDYHRFRDEVARYIKKNESFSYRTYDNNYLDFGAYIEIEPKPLMIVEGTYSQHIEYRSIYDLKVFFDIDYNTQRQIAYNMAGPEGIGEFCDVFLPLENKYFDASEIKDKSHMVIEN